MFSMPGMPFVIMILCAGSQYGKSSMMWRPVCGLVLVVEVRLRRAGPVRAEEGAERMVERLHVDADELDAALDDPFRAPSL